MDGLQRQIWADMWGRIVLAGAVGLLGTWGPTDNPGSGCLLLLDLSKSPLFESIHFHLISLGMRPFVGAGQPEGFLNFDLLRPRSDSVGF
jgi:hypothetical protein